MHLRNTTITFVLVATAAFSQAPLRLKNRVLTPGASAAPQMEVAVPTGRAHKMVQFAAAPTQETLDTLAARGIVVTGAVPVNGLVVTIDSNRISAADAADLFTTLGATYVAGLDAADKVSPMIQTAKTQGPVAKGFGSKRAAQAAEAGDDTMPYNGYFVVEFHTDVDPAEVRSLILNQGVGLVENPDLASNNLLVHFTSNDQMAVAIPALTSDDRIAYIFPASDELINGSLSPAYAAALTAGGAVGQYIATNGNGWDGAGQNGTTLSYVFSQMTTKVPVDQAKDAILRAMAEWSKVVKVSWTPGTNGTATRTVNILFASGAHNDGFPFDGRGGVLAHTFYPAPLNPEPIAGDMHFDGDESWNIGVNTDVYSVALHELGHALGLGHSDNPNDVMYPYYKIVTTLAAGDKAAILTMYAAQDGTPSTPTAPATPSNPTTPTTPSNPTAPTTPTSSLTMTVAAPVATTTGATVTINGSVAGAVGAVAVTYTVNGATGSAQMNGNNWSIANVALAMGPNTITINAADSSRRVSQVVTVTRTAVNATKDTAPPTLTVATAATTTTAANYSISGTATDNVAVASVTWTTSTGATGAANGIASWNAQVPVMVGFNQITIRATDTTGNSSTRTVTVTRH